MADTFIKKPKSRPGGLRKRPFEAISDAGAGSAAPGNDDEPTESAVVQAAKKKVNSHLVQGTGGFKRKQRNNDLDLELSDDDDDLGAGKDSLLVRHSASTVRERRRSDSPSAEISGQVIKAKERMKQNSAVAQQAGDGLYHGQAAQQHQQKAGFGPQKGGPGNVRTITLVDYQPDVCKDYKETGFCGYGDSCKFLHDRGDYLHGWQLDNSYLSSSAAAGSFMAKQNARENGGATKDDDDSDNEDLPFACLICRKPFGKDPVVTLCGHFYDADCAVKRFAKTGKCFACGKQTNGVFNKATKLIKRIAEREKLKAEAEANQELDEGLDEVAVEVLGRAPEPPTTTANEDESDSGDSQVFEATDDEEEEEEPAPRVKRRPIVEVE